ncbi:MAG: hypothetical protein IJ105_02540 [Bacilli bacterium]|nr:hypothetical protein [Bacilli bacterium]
MDGIFFLILAFFTIYTSIKLSYYGDKLSKQSKLGTAFIGGLLIASITSLPEFVTSLSAVIFDNPTLSFGDIVGSNMFNIFVLAVYNIYFFKSDFFKNTTKKHLIECLILFIDYIFIIIGTFNVVIDYISVVLIIMYISYMIFVFKSEKEKTQKESKEKYIIIKFMLTALVMIILSIFLTYQADKISKIYPNFSSSSIGAILLGITTSLPEVVTTFALIKFNNFDMAISNMLGSNIFNFLVLSFSDIFIKNDHIYNYSDRYSLFYLIGGLLITMLLSLTISSNKSKKIYYLFISLLIILSYLYVWYLQFT